MKIAVIGGAGVRTVIFINGLLKRYKKLHIDEVVLYDIQEEKQRIIEKLCKHVVERNHEELKVWAVSDPVEAITGADYIVTTLRVGGDHSRVVDETIALDLGVIGQETTGVGGFSMAVRTIPVLMEYCELIKKYAPDAWIFNFTNPSGLVTQALRSAGYDKIIGICDAPSSTKFRMAHDLGVEEDDLYVEFFGLNRLSWIRSVKRRGNLTGTAGGRCIFTGGTGILHVRSGTAPFHRIPAERISVLLLSQRKSTGKYQKIRCNQRKDHRER